MPGSASGKNNSLSGWRSSANTSLPIRFSSTVNPRSSMDTAHLRAILRDLQATRHDNYEHFSCQNSAQRNNLCIPLRLDSILGPVVTKMFFPKRKITHLVCRLAAQVPKAFPWWGYVVYHFSLMRIDHKLGEKLPAKGVR